MTMLEDYPRALQIVSLHNDRLDLMEDGSRVTYILNKCRDKKVVVISITGTARKGKSFLMSFILQYLRHNGWMIAAHDWMRDIDKSNCFEFGPGTTPVTKGIFMWSEPILVKDHEGNQMAVLLVDAQGLYDEKTSTAGNKLLCALMSLMSSLLLLNIQGSLDEKYLESFSEMFDFGRQVIADEGRNPFQQLIFVVRDFDLEEDLVGWEGGKKELDRFLSESDEQSWDNHYNRRKMKACYPNPGCFLFPHPGIKVTKKVFQGKLNHIEVDFLQAVKSFVGRLPQEAKVRSMDGLEMTGNDLFRWMEVIVPKLNDYIATATSRGLKAAGDTAQALVLIRKYYDQYMNDVALEEINLNLDDTAERQSADDFEYNLKDIHFKAKQKALGSLSKNQVAKIVSIDYQSIHGTPSNVLKALLDARYKEGMDAFSRLIEWKKTMEKQAWHKDKMSLMKDELPDIRKKLSERAERLLHDMEQTKIPKPGYWETVGKWCGTMKNAAGSSFVVPLVFPAAMIVAAGEVISRK